MLLADWSKYRVEYSARALQARFCWPSVASGGAERRAIAKFSEESRRRLFRFVAGVAFERSRFLFLTLTYPKKYPKDGQICKRHLEAFFKRWERKFGPIQCVWKMEFQRRGAPHFHLMVTRPAGHLIKAVRFFTKMAWFQVVSSGDDAHFDAGTQVDLYIRSDPATYFAGHAKGTNHYQNQVPKDFRHVGRFWGVRRLKRQTKVAHLNRDQFIRLRRIIRNYKRSLFRDYKQRSRLTGFWCRMHPGEALTEKLLQFLGVYHVFERKGSLDPASGEWTVCHSLPAP